MELRSRCFGEGAESPTRPFGVVEFASLTIVSGIFAGGAFASFDILYHTRGLAPDDVLVAWGFAAVPATLATVLFALLGAMGAAMLRLAPQRQSVIGAFAAWVVVGLATSVVLAATKSHRDYVGMLLILGSLPVAGLAFAVVHKLRVLARPGQAILWLLGMVQILMIVICGGATVDARGIVSPVKWFLGLLGIAGLAFLIRFSAAAPRRLAAALAIGLPVSGGLFATIAGPGTARPSKGAIRESGGPPNVLLIVLDTMRRDHLGCYGHTGGLTPVLDALAAEGVVYEDAISAAPWTVPAHASMFTGLHPISHGCSYDYRLWLDDEFVTLAERLSEQGYQTAAFVSNYYLRQCNLLQGFDKKVFLEGPYGDLALSRLARIAGFPESWVDKGSRQACESLAEWLRQDHKPDEPFFLFFNLLEPHEPYLPPLAERMAFLPPGIGYRQASWYLERHDNDSMHVRASTAPRPTRLVRAMYQAEVAYQDAVLGELLSMLRDHCDIDNTVVIVTADHGENLGENGRWGHQYALNDQLLRVPLIIRYPRRFPPGTRVAGLCQTTDLFPTILALTDGGDLVDGTGGRSLNPASFEPMAQAYSQVAPHYLAISSLEMEFGSTWAIAALRTSFRSIRTEQFKYVWSSSGDHGLYDVVNDPLEAVNLFEQKPDIAAELHERLTVWRASQPPYAPKRDQMGHEPSRDERAIERLRALGYVR